MSEKKTCPLLLAAAIGGSLHRWDPWDLEWLLREPVPVLFCSREHCALWRDGSGCGLGAGSEELKNRGTAE